MEFEFDTRQEALFREIAALCRKHVPESGLSLAKDAEAALENYPEALRRALVGAGAYNLVSDGIGGPELDFTDTAIITEAVAGVSFSALLLYMSTAPFASLLQNACTPEQKARWTPGLKSGKTGFTLALVEPDAGSDWTALQCVAEPTGDGYVLNGCKNYVTAAAHADYIAVVARAPGSADIRAATSVLMVPVDAPGVTIENRDLTAGRSVGCAEVHLKDVQVGKDHLLGAENQAWGSVILAIGLSRLLVAAASVGLARNVFEKAHAYALEREQFGRPIGRFQAIAHRLADMATEIEVMRLMTYQATAFLDEGDIADKHVSMAKVYCTEKLDGIVMSALKILGGRACLRDESISRKMDETTLLLCQGGTNEVVKTFIKKCLDLEHPGIRD